MSVKLNNNIEIVEKERKIHSKASEEYIHVKFIYSESVWDGWVPIEYRRTGTSLKTDDEIFEHLNIVYDQMNPKKFDSWKKEQDSFWATKPKATVTKGFFDKLVKGGWQCICTFPENPNWARRIQVLKEYGYTLATDTKRYCEICKENNTHLILLPIKRNSVKGNGYETWSPFLRKKIIKVLNGIDVYENVKNTNCLPDHKFPEIRWDKDTKTENPDDMTNEEIIRKFQLLTNQRNQQKREVCRTCFQTGKRGYLFGIKYYYSGNEDWNCPVQKGKNAELGCVGCGWYDIAEWRKQVLKILENTPLTSHDT